MRACYFVMKCEIQGAHHGSSFLKPCTAAYKACRAGVKKVRVKQPKAKAEKVGVCKESLF